MEFKGLSNFLSFVIIYKMDKYVKVLSVESGEITATDNLRNFRIPAGDVYSLRDSFINLNCTMDVVETTAGGGNGVYNTGVQWVTNQLNKPHFDNVAVVRNASLKSARQGVIESIRRVDVLKQNMGIPSEGLGQVLDKSYININQIAPPIQQQNYSLFQQLNKTGTIKSRNAPITPISIRLSDIYDFCDTDEYDTVRGGELSMHLELNRAKLVAVQNMLTAAVHPAQILSFMDIATAAGVGNSITVGATNVQMRITDLAQSPYYVGQKLLINATGNGNETGAPNPAVPPANVVNAPAVISSIVWTKPNAAQATSGKLTLTFESAWGATLTGTQGYEAVTATVAICTPTLRMNEAELVLKRLNANEVRGYDSINYTTFTCEEGSGNNNASFQNLFTIEPRANQAFMCFAAGNDDLLSSTAITSFRCALNNIDITDRDVVVKSPLYYDRLAQSLRGMGRRFNNGVMNTGSATATGGWGATFTYGFNASLPLVASMFATESNKFLQVRTGGAAIGAYQLFKSIPRVFTY
tara:strand:+ start:2182 stop:3759 length:1578 start_codon:yes stop_codon:yes gene_type:complete